MAKQDDPFVRQMGVPDEPLSQPSFCFPQHATGPRGGATSAQAPSDATLSVPDNPLVLLLETSASLGTSDSSGIQSKRASESSNERHEPAARLSAAPRATPTSRAEPVEICLPLLALDPKEFVRVTSAARREKMQKWRKEEEDAEARRRRSEVAASGGSIAVPPRQVCSADLPLAIAIVAAAAGGAEPKQQLPVEVPRLQQGRSVPFSLPRSAFASDVDFVTDAMQRFCVSDNDVVDWVRGTWRPKAS